MTVQPSRRAALAASVAGVVAVGALRAEAGTPTGRPAPVSHDPAVHAARRLTFGATPALIAHIRAIGLPAWLDQQLSDRTDVRATLASPLASVPLPPLVLAGDNGALLRLQAATFNRAMWGDNQLYELLVELWSNHLAIRGDTVGPLKVTDDREVIRKHALGTFSDMLVASSRSPAMLRYLNNDVSIGAYPNENYARELLELHTVGAAAGYRSRDVHEAARALTGLAIDPSTSEFRYNKDWHARGRVRVMGWSHANSDPAKGLAVATSLVRYLATHPATAHRIATKLVRRLVSDRVSPSLVSSTAAVYLASGTAIVPTVRHVVLSREFAGSAGQKGQRPFDWITAAARALGLQQDPIGGDTAIRSTLFELGQVPFEWPRPDGYPDVSSAWTSNGSMLARWNTTQALVSGRIAGLRAPDFAALIGTPVPATGGALVDRLVRRMLGAPPRTALAAALLRSAGLRSATPLDAARAKQLAPQLAALILCSPEAMTR